MRIILASASPRRRELLGKLFDEFEVVPAEGGERYGPGTPGHIVMELALAKAQEVRGKCAVKHAVRAEGPAPADGGMVSGGNKPEDILVIGSDTVVAIENTVLGKPADEDDAAAMLRRLSGRTHQVYTGVAVLGSLGGDQIREIFFEKTDVTFAELDEREIAEYVATGEPMDKAGSYGIQGLGGRFVTRIEGDYTNVVGFPVGRVYQCLKRLLLFTAQECPFTGHSV